MSDGIHLNYFYFLYCNSATVTLYITAAERDKPIFGHPWTTGNPWINLTIPENFDVGEATISLSAWDYVEGKLFYTV
jgi:hypothetical protein